METLKPMPGHTRFYRRITVYYHRAIVPEVLLAIGGKREETSTLNTKDHQQAFRLVKVAAVEIDQQFELPRQRLKSEQQTPSADLNDAQVAIVRAGVRQDI